MFVSHARQDKPAIRHIVRALLGANIPLWADDPSMFGLDPEEVSRFMRIRAGGRWEDEIDEAKRRAGCILVCWSRRATTEGAVNLRERHVWFEEASYARTEQKLVACVIDDMNTRDLPGSHFQQQMTRVGLDRPDELRLLRIAALVTDVKRKLEEVNQRRFASRVEQGVSRSALAKPFFADRVEQEESFEVALAEASSRGGVRPFIVAGPENECVDKLIDRLTLASARRLQSGSWRMAVLREWPRDTTAKTFADAYMRRLWLSLGSEGDASEEAIAQVLQREPIALLHAMLASDWKSGDDQRINAWLDFWGRMAKRLEGARVFPIVSLQMDPAKPGWKECPPGFSGRVHNRQLWNNLRNALKHAKRAGIELSFPPLLHPIEHGHAHTWVEAYVDEDEREAARRLIGEIYAPGSSPRKHGLNHQSFADRLAPLFLARQREGT